MSDGISAKIDREMEEIEAAQGQLRDSIERTKELAEDVDRLLNQHKQTLKDEAAKGSD